MAAPERYDTVGGFSATICRYRAKLLCDVRNPHIFLCCDYCGAVSDLLSAVLREMLFTAVQGVIISTYLPYAFLINNIYGDHIEYAFAVVAV